jgi:alkaline phosphatase D
VGLACAGLRSPRAFAQLPGDPYPFTLGVASGDPTPRSVMVWTRLAPVPLAAGGGMPPEPYRVRFEVARDAEFRRIVRRGAVAAVPEEAHSARVELGGLRPRRQYFYRFEVGGETSPVGRTWTAPPRDATLETLRFAFVSCQNFPDGYFNAYADIVARDVDLVVHLGDYIYEGDASDLRAHEPPREVRSLDDYRIRHAQYKSDVDLQAAHAALPWLATWDDHEVDNNYAGFDADPDAPPEEFARRRAAAYEAYWEHMPLRRSRKPVGPDLPLFRRFRWGTMATFNVLDTRQYRTDQPRRCTPEERDPSGYCPDALEPGRTLMGAAQRDWLLEELATTASRWNVLANPSPLAPFDRDSLPESRAFGAGDTWDGYVAERQKLLDWIVDHGTPNPIVITGDSHANAVRNVPPDHVAFDAAPVATEFLGTSISSGGDPPEPVTRFQDDPGNPHTLFANNNRGYVLCTVAAEAWTSEYRAVPTVRARPVEAATLATFAVEDGRPGAQLAGAPAV